MSSGWFWPACSLWAGGAGGAGGRDCEGIKLIWKIQAWGELLMLLTAQLLRLLCGGLRSGLWKGGGCLRGLLFPPGWPTGEGGQGGQARASKTHPCTLSRRVPGRAGVVPLWDVGEQSPGVCLLLIWGLSWSLLLAPVLSTTLLCCGKLKFV